MSQELFNRLEEKVTATVEALELAKMEADELREENEALKQERESARQEREEWERRLNGLLSKFDENAV